ncbi:MAG TPA: hypothetical protein VFS20_06600, partial [Longimicrobium sp.]|nr:hypothetical protein [Longimicrobium sp.]
HVLLTDLAIAHGYCGQPRRSVALLGKTLDDWNNGRVNAGNLGNLAFFEISLGELAAAEQHQRGALDVTSADEALEKGYGQLRLGLILTYTGRFTEAAREFRTALAIMQRERDPRSECHLWTYRGIRAQLLGDLHLALVCARRAHRLADASGNQRQRVRSADLFASVWLSHAEHEPEAARRRRILEAAETLLSEAMVRCRQLDLVELEAGILLHRAQWHRAMGNLEEARRAAGEGLLIADRCEYRIQAADIHNFFALLALEGGQPEVARQEALLGEACSLCDGEPHAYSSGLKQAQAILERIARI